MKKYVVFFLIFTFLSFPYNVKAYSEEKVIYLTFDDGPSKVTLDIIKTLKEFKVPGTFFVIGEKCEENQKEFKLLVDSDNDICVHSHTHNYAIYNSVALYMKDYSRCKETIEKYTGKDVGNLIRFPGGSFNRLANRSSLVRIKNNIVENGLYYVDWNVSIEDSVGGNPNVSNLMKNITKDYKKQERVVLLMHDTINQKTTAKALPEIIEFFKAEGYVFKSLNKIDSGELEILIKNKVVNKYYKKVSKKNE